METRKITILAHRLGEAQERAAKMLKKATRYGVDLSITFGDVYQEKRPVGIKKAMVNVVDVTLSGSTPVVGDYEFQAAIELTPNGNFVDTPPGVEIDPKYRTTDGRCEHCQTNRSRKHVFAVMNRDTGETVQVGRTCLRDFLGTDDADGVIQKFNFWRSYRTDDGDDDWGFGGFGSSERMDLIETLLAKTNALIRLYGWCGASAAYHDDRLTSTVSRLWNTYGMDSIAQAARRELNEALRPSDDDMAKKVIEWVRASTEDNDYMFKLRLIFAEDVLYGDKRTSLAISAVFSYHRAMERELKYAEAKKANRDSKHQGAIKERLKGLSLTVKMIRDMGDNGWGPTELVKMADEAGNLFSWFTGSRPCFDTGDVLVADGTVKAHKDFHGSLETQLTRVTVKEVQSDD